MFCGEGDEARIEERSGSCRLKSHSLSAWRCSFMLFYDTDVPKVSTR